MATKVKELKPVKAWAVLVGLNKDTLNPAFVWTTRKGAKNWTSQFGGRYPNIAKVLIIEDTPANRKRLGLGVKRA